MRSQLRMRIWFKMMWAPLVVIVVLVAVSAYGYRAIARMAGTAETLDQLERTVAEAQAVETEIARQSSYFQAYMRSAKEEDLARLRESAGRVRERLDGMIAGAGPEIREKLESLQADQAAYLAAVEKAASLVAARQLTQAEAVGSAEAAPVLQRMTASAEGIVADLQAGRRRGRTRTAT